MRRLAAPLLGLALIATPAAAQDDDGGFLERTLENALSGNGRDVTVSGFRGALSSTATIDEMTFADADGTWLTIRDAELNWSRLALVRGRVQVEHLRAGEIILARPPLSADAAPSAEASGFSLPELPVSVNIGEITTDRLEIGEALFGLAAELTLTGQLRLEDGAGEGRIAAERTDGQAGIFNIAGAFDNASRNLSVSTRIEEAEDGIIATLANLPGRPSLLLQVTGQGPLSNFAADLSLATDNTERIAGTLEIAGQDGTTGFAADITGDIAPLTLPEFQDFFGTEVALTVNGNQSADGILTIETLDLSAQQLDLAGSLRIGPGGLPLDLDLTGEIAAEDGTPVLIPSGGADTRVDRADLVIQFDADEGEGWTADITVLGLAQGDIAIDTLELDGRGTITAEDGPAVTADLNLTASGTDLGDPDAQTALGDTVTALASIAWEQGGPLDLSALDVTGETYRLTGAAVAQTTDGQLDISGAFDATADDLAPFSGLAGRPLSGSLDARLEAEAAPVAGTLDLTLDGEGQNLTIGNAELDSILAGTATLGLALRRDETGTYLDRLETQTDAAEITAQAQIASTGGSGEAQVLLRDAALLSPKLSGPLTLTATAEGDAGLWEVDATLDGAGLSADADLSADVTGDVARFSGKATASAERLDPFAGLAGRDIGGAFDLASTGDAAADLSDFDVTLTGETTDLAIGIPQVDGLLAGQMGIDAAVAGTAGSLTIRTLNAEAPNLQLTGAGTVGRDAPADLTIEARLPAPEILAPGLPGPLTFTGAVTGGPDILNVQADLAAPETEIDLDADVTLTGPVPSIAGTARVAAADLAPFSTLAGRDLAGRVELAAQGSALTDFAEFDLALAGTTTDLAVGFPQADALLAGSTAIDVAARREGDTLTTDRLSVENAALRVRGGGSLSLDQSGMAEAEIILRDPGLIAPGLPGPLSVSANANGGPELWDIGAAIDGPALDGTADLTVDLSGTAPRADGTLRIDARDLAPFSDLAGRALGGSITVTAEGGGTADLSAFDITLAADASNLRSGSAEADRLLSGQTTLRAEAARDGAVIRLPVLNIQNPQISLEATATTGADQNTGDFSLRLANLGIFVPELQGPVMADGSARQTGGGDWQIDASATGPAGITADIGGTAASDFATLGLTASGALPLAIADPVLTPRALDGTAQFEFAIDGAPGLDAVSGRVTTADARFVDPALGIVLTNIQTDLGLSAGSATLDLRSAVQAGGNVAVSGGLGLSGGFPADVTVTLDGAVLEQPGLYITSLDGGVSLNGPLAGGAAISGRIELNETEIGIPSSLGGVTAIPDLKHINEPATVRATRERAGLIKEEEVSSGGGGPAYPLDLTISAPNQVFIRGRGLDAELGGELTILGTTAAPQPAGQFELIRGRLDILGQRLSFDEGTATLQGDLDPSLRLIASTEAEDDTDVFVTVEGPASAPDISFSSDPDLPEDEVVARLLFGRGIDELSPLQIARLAGAVARLAGGGGLGLIGSAREGLGLADLDVTQSEEGGVGVRAGTYLTENIYTNVEVDNAGSEVSINLDLTPSTTARVSADNDGESSIGVFFERDY